MLGPNLYRLISLSLQTVSLFFFSWSANPVQTIIHWSTALICGQQNLGSFFYIMNNALALGNQNFPPIKVLCKYATRLSWKQNFFQGLCHSLCVTDTSFCSRCASHSNIARSRFLSWQLLKFLECWPTLFWFQCVSLYCWECSHASYATLIFFLVQRTRYDQKKKYWNGLPSCFPFEQVQVCLVSCLSGD